MNCRLLLPALLLVLLAVCVSCWSATPVFYGQATDPAVIGHGRDLTRGLAACGFCHGESRTPGAILSGGQVLHDRFGSVIAPNITPHSSGVGDWSTTELVHALRFSVGKDGRLLSPEMHKGYEWMSDADMLAILSYLSTLPPVAATHDVRELSLYDKNIAGLTESWKVYQNYVPALAKKDRIVFGRYLTDHVAMCGSCHNQPDTLLSSGDYLGGGKRINGPTGDRFAPALVVEGVPAPADWSEDELVLFLQTGRTPDGRIVDSKYCPVDFYREADTADLQAIALFIQSLS